MIFIPKISQFSSPIENMLIKTLIGELYPGIVFEVGLLIYIENIYETLGTER